MTFDEVIHDLTNCMVLQVTELQRGIKEAKNLVHVLETCPISTNEAEQKKVDDFISLYSSYAMALEAAVDIVNQSK